MMPTGFRNSAGADLELLFAPGTVQVPGFRDSAGNTLQFAARGAAAKIPDVGFRDASGSDVSNTWLGASSLPPVSDGGLPAFLESVVTSVSGGGITAACSFSFLASGTVTWSQAGGSGGGSGVWLNSGAAADYSIRLTDLGSTGGLAGATGAWLVLSSDRQVSLTASVPPGVGEEQQTQTATVRIEIRRNSDSAVLLSRNIAMSATAERIV